MFQGVLNTANRIFKSVRANVNYIEKAASSVVTVSDGANTRININKNPLDEVISRCVCFEKCHILDTVLRLCELDWRGFYGSQDDRFDACIQNVFYLNVISNNC